MTLEELRLRVEAAFPGAILGGCRDILWAELRGERVEIQGTVVLMIGVVLYAGRPEVLAAIVGDERHAIEDEIQRRILSVSAHALIAARRRLDLADAQ